MKPYIHHIYEYEDNMVGKYIMTIKGKSKLKRWVMKPYFEKIESIACFSLEGEDIYWEAIPFVWQKGKNKGDGRVIYSRLDPKFENLDDMGF